MEFIRNLYRPLQPAENDKGLGKLFYKEQLPADALRPYIHCFWELRTLEALNATCLYRVVADGCIDMIIDTHTYNGSLLAGIADSAFEVPVENEAGYFGIRFLPAGIHHFWKMDAAEIQNQMLNTGDLLPKETEVLSAMIFESKSFTQRIAVAQSYLLSLLAKNNSAMHPALARALHHILSTGGDLPIQTKAAEYISPRQLRRLFNDHVGCSPKLFARIVRFQQTLKMMQDERGTGHFYKQGYFDQAHFIREFKIFYGDTPTEASR
ncbi:MAG TPA: helix-turn-helix domain-containing protein [Chitinophagaceae bacterium]|jgi:AraC-like DNA-binding protein|nr:helix-turn-helix domain-containing protein [Chitinophagaceae bacterium]